MRARASFRCLLVTATLVASASTIHTGAAQDQRDVGALLAHVSERVAAYYQHAQRLICVERSTVTPIGSDWRWQGFGRTVESELRLEVDGMIDGGGLSEPRVTRQVRRINGREPRDRDKVDRSGCTDPTPLSPEPLAFLLPERRDEYRFTSVREGRERDRAALIIDFASARQKGQPVLVEDEHGHDDCFDWKGPIQIAGRVWVDAATHDVLRVERRIAGPTDVRVPFAFQRKYGFSSSWVTIDRDDETIRYKQVEFSDPEEVMLLPESIESMTVLRSDLQSVRRTQVFSDYRRFLTGGRVIKGGFDIIFP
jgi:hypothetical protein